MTRSQTLAAGALVILCANACAVSGTPFQNAAAPAGKAVVYVYRPYAFGGGGVRPTVTCGSEGVSLGPGGYHPYLVDPGTVTCHTKTEVSADVDVQATAEQPSYVKEEIGMGFVVGHPHLYLMDSNSGQQEIAACKQQN
jgi:hypothetical protein